MDDLRDLLLALMHPVRPGDLLAPGLRLTDASTELGLRLSFLVDERDVVHVEVSPRTHGMKFAARTDHLALAYRHGGAETVEQTLGLRVCQQVAAHVRPREAEVLARMAAAVATHATQPEAARRIREVRSTRLLELAGTPEHRFYTLSPYLGCLIGCRFCYAQSRLDPMRDLLRLPQVPWGSYVDVRVNAAELLAAELAALPRHPIKFCPIVSDPYQAVEHRYGLTRACLEVLANTSNPPPVMVMTRSTLMLRDLELLRSLPGAWVGASIPTIDDTVRAHFEPRAASIPARLDMLGQFKAAGVARCVVVQPILPGDRIALADALAAVTTSISLGVLRGELGAAEDFADPRYEACRSEAWQREAAEDLHALLTARGVTVWFDELPPELAAWAPT